MVFKALAKKVLEVVPQNESFPGEELSNGDEKRSWSCLRAERTSGKCAADVMSHGSSCRRPSLAAVH